jgi:hypothetical protein
MWQPARPWHSCGRTAAVGLSHGQGSLCSCGELLGAPLSVLLKAAQHAGVHQRSPLGGLTHSWALKAAARVAHHGPVLVQAGQLCTCSCGFVRPSVGRGPLACDSRLGAHKPYLGGCGVLGMRLSSFCVVLVESQLAWLCAHPPTHMTVCGEQAVAAVPPCQVVGAWCLPFA